ncbi:dipeptidase [Jiangella alkaliphila]|uniref:Acetylornithine deacetylase/Succinyl-diaminopimelate desuccinylase n=1 Tax=Jiangella alkaliphila TaxID=419479 RepID=A0A1H2GIF2_9ACTN|nr:dipeptidase [Jiangella alkaliphila]SDU19292.1 Acetylornithine deacetylase/Succinyl-diaminopimelate desuccinylase [Jiangella alkaliphila]
MTDLRAAVEAILPSARADLERLVRIPSVSADPARAGDVLASAEAVAELARGAGAAQADVVSAAGGRPAVIASWPAPEGAPTVLLYAHHDVQPTGPREGWTTDPFEPTERDGRLYGRGSSDDKAGVATHLAALRAFDGRPPVGVVLFAEGEEEIGSPSFTPFLETYRDRLAADVIVVADSANWTAEVPAITTSLRGGVDCLVTLRVLQKSVHSGLFGGPVVDALTALTRLMATLHDDKGDVAIAGLISTDAPDIDFPDERYRSEAGVLDGVHLVGSGSLTERLWTRPTASVLAIDAPAVADAANILVHEARAKVSVRIAPEQDPRAALDALEAHLREHVEFGAQIEITEGMVGGGCALPTEGPVVEAAEAALTEAFGVPSVRTGIGGSIPFIAEFEKTFPDATVLVTGMGDPLSGPHGLNESLDLAMFAKGCLAEVLLLDRLSRLPG